MIDTPDLIDFTPGLRVGDPMPNAPMTGAELRSIRERLGLTSETCALMLGLYDAEALKGDPAALAKARRTAERKMRRWEQGQNPVASNVPEGIELLQRVQASMMADLVERLVAADSLVLTIPAGDTANFPGGWWRALAGAMQEEVAGLRIVYADE